TLNSRRRPGTDTIRAENPPGGMTGSPAVNNSWRSLVLLVVVVFAGAVFLIDLATPLGVEVWVLYLPVILAPVWFNNTRQVAVAAGACSFLVILGAFFSPQGGGIPPWSDVLNRGMGLLAIWLTAFAGMTITRRSIQLGEAMKILQREVAQHEQAKGALAESEERMRLAMQIADVSTWDVDVPTGKAVWSETLFRMLGYEPPPGASPRATRRARPPPPPPPATSNTGAPGRADPDRCPPQNPAPPAPPAARSPGGGSSGVSSTTRGATPPPPPASPSTPPAANA